MPGTWPDTTVESPDGARTSFTLSSGLTPINPLVTVGGATGALTVSPTQFAFVGAVMTLTFAPVLGEIVNVYFLPTGATAGTPGVTTLGAMRNVVRQRADLVGSLFITDAELNGWINSSVQELYDLLIQKYGDDWYLAEPYTLTTDGTTERFPLPTDLYKIAGVEWKNGSDWIDVKRFNFHERNRGGVRGFAGAVGGRSSLKYRLMGSKLWLRSGSQPASSGMSVRLWYAPRFSLLVNDGDAVDCVSGWEEYPITDCVIKCRQKGEEDPGVELALKAALLKRIEEAAENRDESEPQTVTDVRGGGWPGEEWF